MLSRLISVCCHVPEKNSHTQPSISRFDSMKQAFLPHAGSRDTTESIPRWAWSRSATTAPTNTSQTNSQRDSSSEIEIPELNPYRSTTLPNTSTTIPSMHRAMKTRMSLKLPSTMRIMLRLPVLDGSISGADAAAGAGARDRQRRGGPAPNRRDGSSPR